MLARRGILPDPSSRLNAHLLRHIVACSRAAASCPTRVPG
jgi:hypothetical protein